jgi:hypothetical protein
MQLLCIDLHAILANLEKRAEFALKKLEGIERCPPEPDSPFKDPEPSPAQIRDTKIADAIEDLRIIRQVSAEMRICLNHSYVPSYGDEALARLVDNLADEDQWREAEQYRRMREERGKR